MSDLDKFLYQVMQILALFSGVVVILMIGTTSVPIPSIRICLDWLRSFEVRQVTNLWEESLIGVAEGSEYHLLLLPTVSPLVNMPQLV